MAHAFLFRSGKRPEFIAFTDDETGGNLPAELGPWQAMGGQALSAGPDNAVAAALQAQGYYIAYEKPVDC